MDKLNWRREVGAQVASGSAELPNGPLTVSVAGL